VRELAGRVAVVTGAASGIGRALARHLGARGMRVVVADVERRPLAETAELVRAAGGEALAVPTDVSDGEAVAALAAKTLEHFVGGATWSASVADYAWVLDVNVWGVIHGIRTFVPILLERGEPGHVVNTASMAALTSSPYAGPYAMSKHAVLALSECLYHELQATGAPIGVTVLCPEAVATGIATSDRNRPARSAGSGPATPERALVRDVLARSTAAGLSPDVMADRVERAILDGRFYVIGEDDWRRCCDVRLDDIRLGRNPTFTAPEGLG
jgi:NAD(P)-dependent dehydrogenase (short-subunit alcohol dehydrogenase family)